MVLFGIIIFIICVIVYQIDKLTHNYVGRELEYVLIKKKAVILFNNIGGDIIK